MAKVTGKKLPTFYFLMASKMFIEHPQTIRFKCVKCGVCCGDTAVRNRQVLLLESEAISISNATKKTIPEFAAKISDKEPYRYEMVKTPHEGKCVFLKEDRCTIYRLRPLVCKFYPFELKTTSDRTTSKHKFSFTKECIGIGKGEILQKRFYTNLLHTAEQKLNEDKSQV